MSMKQYMKRCPWGHPSCLQTRFVFSRKLRHHESICILWARGLIERLILSCHVGLMVPQYHGNGIGWAERKTRFTTIDRRSEVEESFNEIANYFCSSSPGPEADRGFQRKGRGISTDGEI